MLLSVGSLTDGQGTFILENYKKFSILEAAILQGRYFTPRWKAIL